MLQGREICHIGCKRLKVFTDAVYGCEKNRDDRLTTFSWFGDYLYFEDSAFTVQRMKA